MLERQTALAEWQLRGSAQSGQSLSLSLPACAGFLQACQAVAKIADGTPTTQASETAKAEEAAAGSTAQAGSQQAILVPLTIEFWVGVLSCDNRCHMAPVAGALLLTRHWLS